MSNTSIDLVLMNYQLNENYHDSKEKSGWIAITLFFTFSISSLSFVIKFRSTLGEMLLYSFVYFVISGLSFVFISKQFYRKAETVVLTYCFKMKFKDVLTPELKRLIKEKYTWVDIISLYNMEIPLFIIAIILYFILQYQIIERLKIFDMQIYNYLYFVYFILGIPFLISLILINLWMNVQEIQNDFIEENMENPK